MTAEDMKNRKSYSLTELVAQCDPDAPMPETFREWDQAAPVGLEQVVMGDQVDIRGEKGFRVDPGDS
jgi:antitoxin ChpS